MKAKKTTQKPVDHDDAQEVVDPIYHAKELHEALCKTCEAGDEPCPLAEAICDAWGESEEWRDVWGTR